MRRIPEAGGFTLVEMIVTLVLVGILAGLGVQFVRPAVDAYSATVKRQGLTDAASLIGKRLERDIRGALANSVRVQAVTNGYALELIPVRGGGMYRAFPTAAGGGNVLRFDTSDSAFDVVGPTPVYTTSHQLVIANLGTGSGADAYAGSNRSAVSTSNSTRGFSTDAGPHTVSFSAMQFPAPSASNRFQLVDTPLMYLCDTSAGTLTLYQGYGWNATVVAPPTGGSSSVVTSQLGKAAAACAFRYTAGTANSRSGLVSIELRLTSSSGENVDLVVQVNVSNEP